MPAKDSRQDLERRRRVVVPKGREICLSLNGLRPSDAMESLEHAVAMAIANLYDRHQWFGCLDSFTSNVNLLLHNLSDNLPARGGDHAKANGDGGGPVGHA